MPVIMARNLDNFKFRVIFVSGIILLVGGLLAGRLFFIQVVEHDYYANRAERQYISYKSKEEIAIRGNIYFQEKDGTLISAATVKDGYLVAVMPNLVDDPEEVCDALAGIIVIDKDDCIKRSSKDKDPYEEIAHYIGSDVADKIIELNMNGLGVFPEQWRFYPGKTLASQLLGFVGFKGDDRIGRYGIEQYYEEVLKGEKESLKEGSSFAMLFYELGKELLNTNADSGHDVVLTIELSVQSVLENILSELLEDWDAKSAGGIILDPNTGAVLAMASKPDFDLNNYSKIENASRYRNPVVSDIFEVGSVVKPLTLSAAIDAGKITSDTTYFDRGFVVLDGRRIENYDGKGRGRVDMQTVLSKSLNTGAIFVMQQLGKENFLDYFEKYGLGEKTGIDLPDEVTGKLSNLNTTRSIEYATASFGHGIAFSPIEFAVAVSSVANGGFIVKPYVVDRIIVDGGKDRVTEPVTKRRVLKQETSEEMNRMLTQVVDEALLGGTVKLDHYSVAAKTGTALLPKKNKVGYYDDRYLHSFFGYAPSFDAKFLVYLYLEDPQGVKYASHTLTDPFMKLINFLLSYYEIVPDR